jgi:hypothetical protein
MQQSLLRDREVSMVNNIPDLPGIKSRLWTLPVVALAIAMLALIVAGLAVWIASH